MTLLDRQSGLILFVDGEGEATEPVRLFLERRGYSVDHAADGVTGLHLAVCNCYDAIVLGLRLPGMDGLEVCRKLRREAKKASPVLMLTECNTLDDKLLGLDAGADDYMVKPFEIRELDARLYALIRRSRRQIPDERLTVGSMTLDPGTLRLTREGRELVVQPTGMKLLAILMRESPRTVSRRDIEREIWGDSPPNSDALRSHIYNLRKVIDRPFNHPLFHTMRPTGYRMVDLDESVKSARENIATPAPTSQFDYVRSRTDADRFVMHIDRIGVQSSRK
jgi:DNA-binding response OmpR family regulator